MGQSTLKLTNTWERAQGVPRDGATRKLIRFELPATVGHCGDALVRCAPLWEEHR
jgi:hypothetical protein